MIPNLAGRSLRAALLTCATLTGAQTAAADTLVVETRNGLAIAELAFVSGQEICLSWSHSVTGGQVADCFENRDGVMLLTRSFLHDFAAGLGEILGRGTISAAAEGGYWIDGIDEVIPGNKLLLRVGAPRVGHRLIGAGQRANLSAQAAGARVTLRLERQ